jgi:hypothetical protein
VVRSPRLKLNLFFSFFFSFFFSSFFCDIILTNISHFEPKNFTDEQIAVHTWLEGYALFGPEQFRLMIDGMIPGALLSFSFFLFLSLSLLD